MLDLQDVFLIQEIQSRGSWNRVIEFIEMTFVFKIEIYLISPIFIITWFMEPRD